MYIDTWPGGYMAGREAHCWGGVKWKAHSGSGVKNDRMPSRKKEMNKQEQKRKKKEKKERVEMGGGQNHVRQTW